MGKGRCPCRRCRSTATAGLSRPARSRSGRRRGPRRVDVRDPHLPGNGRSRGRRHRARRRAHEPVGTRTSAPHHGAQHVRPGPASGATRTGAAGGATTRRTTRPCSFSPTTPASRSRWRAARRSTSSPTGSTPLWRMRTKPRGRRTSRSPAAHRRCSSTSAPASSTRWSSTSSRFCSVPASGSSRTSTAGLRIRVRRARQLAGRRALQLRPEGPLAGEGVRRWQPESALALPASSSQLGGAGNTLPPRSC